VDASTDTDTDMDSNTDAGAGTCRDTDTDLETIQKRIQLQILDTRYRILAADTDGDTDPIY